MKPFRLAKAAVTATVAALLLTLAVPTSASAAAPATEFVASSASTALASPDIQCKTQIYNSAPWEELDSMEIPSSSVLEMAHWMWTLLREGSTKTAHFHPFEVQLSWPAVPGATGYLIQRPNGTEESPYNAISSPHDPDNVIQHSVMPLDPGRDKPMIPTWINGGGYVHLTYLVYAQGPDGALSAPTEVPITVTRSSDGGSLTGWQRFVVTNPGAVCDHRGKDPKLTAAPEAHAPVNPPAPGENLLRYSLLCDTAQSERPPISNKDASYTWTDSSGSITTGWDWHEIEANVPTTLEIRYKGEADFLGGSDCIRALTAWTTSSGMANADGAFLHLSNLVDVPKGVPKLTSMNSTFWGATAFNDPDVGSWDTSQVTNMDSTFMRAESFNQPLPWNVSKVTTMNSMFREAAAFNRPLTWNSSSLQDIQRMFFRTSSFNQPVALDTSKVTTMAGTFEEAMKFNQKLSWDTSSVTTMKGMFTSAVAFNQPLSWNTSKVTSMEAMFSGAAALNRMLTFDTSSVTTMKMMFNSAPYFNQPLNWDVSKVTTMERMFSGAVRFNQQLPWNTSSVENMHSMFYNAQFFNQPLNWDVSNVTDMYQMFRDAAQFNQNLSHWTPHQVFNMAAMFRGATSFSQDLSGWEVPKAGVNLNFGLGSKLTPAQMPIFP